MLYDDYVEHEPGAFDALQAYLDSSAYRSRATLTEETVVYPHSRSLLPAASRNTAA